MAKERTGRRSSVSRRNFVAKGAVAAAVAAGAKASTTQRRDTNIKLPGEVPASLAEAPSPADFPMTGAQVFAKACKEEGLAALFCAPGNYTVINALASEGIPCYGNGIRLVEGACAIDLLDWRTAVGQSFLLAGPPAVGGSARNPGGGTVRTLAAAIHPAEDAVERGAQRGRPLRQEPFDRLADRPQAVVAIGPQGRLARCRRHLDLAAVGRTARSSPAA